MKPLVDVAEPGATADVELNEVEGRTLELPASLIRMSTDRIGAGPALHRHPYPETFIVHRGEALFVVGDETFVARGGQVYVAPALTPHRFEKIGEGRLEMTNVHANDVFVTEWLDGR
jgi:mannose-6-phosphate isomerase-like protein (cupin superfamily)